MIKRWLISILAPEYEVLRDENMEMKADIYAMVMEEGSFEAEMAKSTWKVHFNIEDYLMREGCNNKYNDLISETFIN